MTRLSREDLAGAAFEAQVPEHMRQDVMERLSEAAWGGSSEGVTIIDSEKRNVLNVEVTGTILIDGEEVWFHLREGDMDGSVLMGWGEDEPSSGINREGREATVLAPSFRKVSDVMSAHDAMRVLTEWDDANDPSTKIGAKLSKLPAAAAYDAFFAPGTGASASHHRTAEKAGYEIVEESAAFLKRKALIARMIGIVPVLTDEVRRGSDPEGASAILSSWSEAMTRGTEKNGHLYGLMAGYLDRASRISSRQRNLLPEERAAMRSSGYEYASAPHVAEVRGSLIRPLLSVRKIDGFDPATLPEDPMRALFRRLDPALVASTRMDPVSGMTAILDGLIRKMSTMTVPEVPEDFREPAAALGYEIVFAHGISSEPDEDPERDSGMEFS